METLEIGERKVFTDVTLEVVPSKCGDCIGCWFYYKQDLCIFNPRRSIMGNCYWFFRTDGKDVIFKAVKENCLDALERMTDDAAERRQDYAHA